MIFKKSPVSNYYGVIY